MQMMAGKKIAVWFKGRQIVKHVFVDVNAATLQDDCPGTYLVIVEYDDLGNLAQTEVYADGFCISATDHGGMAHGKSLPVAIDLSP